MCVLVGDRHFGSAGHLSLSKRRLTTAEISQVEQHGFEFKAKVEAVPLVPLVDGGRGYPAEIMDFFSLQRSDGAEGSRGEQRVIRLGAAVKLSQQTQNINVNGQFLLHFTAQRDNGVGFVGF